MDLPVLTAVTNAELEAALVTALGQAEHGIAVVRRCADVADLLATASVGVARAALLSADLRHLDHEILTRLYAAGVAIVGLVDAHDEAGERRLRQLGLTQVLPLRSPAALVAEALIRGAAQMRPSSARHMPADPRAALFSASLPADNRGPISPAAPGRVVAVWGPTGAPGRTTLAIGLADEAARLGVPTLLIDADSYGGTIAQMLSMLDEAPGIAAAAHLANNGALDIPALAGLARAIHPQLRVLTGITRPERWVELRPDSLMAVLARARELAAFTVIDCGFCLETDEELSYDTMAPRRNGATLAALASSDIVVAVGAADPVGMGRLIRGLDELAGIVPDTTRHVVVNKTRRGVVPGDPEQEVMAALKRYAGVINAQQLPHDQLAADRAVAVGRTLAEVAPESRLRVRLAQIAESLVGSPALMSGGSSQERRRLSAQPS